MELTLFLTLSVMSIKVGRFLPDGGKNVFSIVKTGLAEIVFAGLPELSSK